MSVKESQKCINCVFLWCRGHITIYIEFYAFIWVQVWGPSISLALSLFELAHIWRENSRPSFLIFFYFFLSWAWAFSQDEVWCLLAGACVIILNLFVMQRGCNSSHVAGSKQTMNMTSSFYVVVGIYHQSLLSILCSLISIHYCEIRKM